MLPSLDDTATNLVPGLYPNRSLNATASEALSTL